MRYPDDVQRLRVVGGPPAAARALHLRPHPGLQVEHVDRRRRCRADPHVPGRPRLPRPMPYSFSVPLPVRRPTQLVVEVLEGRLVRIDGPRDGDELGGGKLGAAVVDQLAHVRRECGIAATVSGRCGIARRRAGAATERRADGSGWRGLASWGHGFASDGPVDEGRTMRGRAGTTPRRWLDIVAVACLWMASPDAHRVPPRPVEPRSALRLPPARAPSPSRPSSREASYAPTQGCTSPLVYCGGPIVASPDVVQVSWNDPGVGGTVAAVAETIPRDWWPAIVSPQAGYLAWLTEYGTVGPRTESTGSRARARPSRGFGSYTGLYRITPSAGEPGRAARRHGRSAPSSPRRSPRGCCRHPPRRFGSVHTLYMIDLPPSVTTVTLTFAGTTAAARARTSAATTWGRPSAARPLAMPSSRTLTSACAGCAPDGLEQDLGHHALARARGGHHRPGPVPGEPDAHVDRLHAPRRAGTSSRRAAAR